MDSIFGDVAMNRVKFDAKQEYEYLANFRILQNSFKVHGIDKVRRKEVADVQRRARERV